jgi:hypothetical protein
MHKDSTEIEMFSDGTNVFWYPDGNVRLEMPPSLSRERKDKHIAYVQTVLEARRELNEDSS